MIISYNKNMTCPPSSAGMGKRFIKAKINEKKAVFRQKISQSQPASKMLPKVTKLPTWEAPDLLKRNRMDKTYSSNVVQAKVKPFVSDSPTV